MATAGNITAVLSLNASGFKTGLDNAKTSVEGFVSQITKSTGQVAGFNSALSGLVTTLNNATLDFTKFTEQAKGVESFNKFANGVKALATAIQTLGTNSETTATGVARVKEIIASMEGVFKNVEIEVKNVVTSFQQMNGSAQTTGYNVKSAFEQAKAELMSMQTGLYRTGAVMSDTQAKIIYQTQQMKNEYRSARSELLAFANGGVEAFNKVSVGVNKVNTTLDSSISKINMYRIALQGMGTTASSLATNFNNVDTSLSTYTSRIGNSTLNTNLQTSAMEKLNVTTSQSSMQFSKLSAEEMVESNAKQNETNVTNQNTSAHQRNSGAMGQANARTNQLTASTNRLKSAMSSLRMVGTLVGSMLAYNFAHKLLVATGETIHAKSEMEGYFKMLNFGQSDIDHFNEALDRTVSQFQRVNKYSLGETISSIGVEFNLTTQEMEKAMKVTSMITSEYLRAGRNANEASLAVKDVLQGQFQRLSRETGVKGEQLKEAGWSGDTTDVLGLMEALEKVGESRNWDVFAEKANSLNDILTILQNRFGEWSADMVYTVQPAIVGAFNMILESGQKLGSVLEGVWQWLTNNPIGQIVGWSLLATHIMSVVTALIHMRTGANLTQIAQMGLRNSILATVLGLEAETVAEHGLGVAIVSNLTSVEAETVAKQGKLVTIASTITGLEAEAVAEMGVGRAIAGTILKLDMEVVARRGVIVALAQRIAQSPLYIGSLKAEEIAEMGTARAGAVLLASLLPLIAVFTALALAIAPLIINLNNSAESMKKFNELVRGGKAKIEENRKAVDKYTNSQKQLIEELGKAKKGSQEYAVIQDKLRATNRDLTVANENLKNSIKAVERANSAQTIFDDTKMDIAIHQQERLTEAYSKMGFSAEKSSELANESMREANEGAEQLRLTLQKLESSSQYTTNKMNEFAQQFKDTDFKDLDRMESLTQDYLNARDLYMKGLEKSMTDESFMGRLDGYFTMTQATIQMDLDEWTIDWETGDIDELWKDIWTQVFADTGIGGAGAINGILREFGLDNIWKGFKISTILDPLHDIIDKTFGGGSLLKLIFGEHDLSGIFKDEFWDWITNLPDPVSEFTNWLKKGEPLIDVSWIDQWIEDTKTSITDGINQLGETLLECWNNITTYDYIGEFLKTWGLENFDFATFWNDHVVVPLTNFFSGIDLMGMIQGLFSGGGDGATGEKTFNFGEIIKGLLDFATMDLSWLPTSIDTYIIQPLKTGLVSGIMNIPLVGTILSLFGLVNGENSGASGKGKEVGDSFKTKVEDIVRNIPILGDVLQFLGVIPQANPDANSKGKGVGTNVKDGFKNGLTGIVDIIKNELQHIIDAIGQRIDDAKSKAIELGNAVVSGVRNAIDPGSPGIIAREIIGNEFGTYIPQVIADNSQMAYTSAQTYGQSIRDGISSVNFNTLDGMATDYQNDAQIISATSQTMGMDTATAFDSMALAVNTTTSTMSGNVVSAYTTMGTKQATMLTDMKTKNTTAYNEMYQKSNQSLIQMRDSTSNLTTQMTNAWTHMKNQIVATANQLKTESTTHFNTLSNTIGTFYRKIQNPANWGANGRSPNSIPSRTSRSSSGRSIAHAITSRTGNKYAGGRDVYSRSLGSSSMSIAQLKRKICPTGNCDIFDGYSPSTRVNPSEFLGMFADDYFFGWNDWASTHYNYIKNKSDEWEMKSPVIQLVGGISTNAKYKVGDFENGSPKISFESFQSMAESIFSRIPYRLYYNSDWKGSWLGALQSGACNCWDGAHALLALANTCGFSGGIGHGSWGSYGHVWAIINGKVMDTTAWQGGYGWTSPKVSGYGAPNISARRPIHNLSENNQSESVKVEVNINGDVYGIDDLNKHIEEGIDKGLQKHFNKSYAVGI